MSNRKLNFLAKANGKELVMEMYDAIGADWFGEGITAQTVTDALKDSHDSVTLRINSPGGDANEGLAIYNVLRAHGKPVNVYVDGVAASAASVIAMAGDSITMGLGTLMMIHGAQGMGAGFASDLRAFADTLDKYTASMADIYAAKTKQPKSTVLDWMNAETWMNADEAVTNGFATAVSTDKGNPQAVLASLDVTRFKFKNAPTTVEARDGKTKKVDGENLTPDDFIYVGNPDETDTWHLPWRFSSEEKTQSHLRDALSRFSQTGIPPTKKAAAKDKLDRLAKEHGIDVGGDSAAPTAEADDYQLDIMRKRLALQRQK